MSRAEAVRMLLHRALDDALVNDPVYGEYDGG
jgi:hypothetical protein